MVVVNGVDHALRPGAAEVVAVELGVVAGVKLNEPVVLGNCAAGNA